MDGPGDDSAAKQQSVGAGKKKGGMAALFPQALHDPVCNRKLIALSTGTPCRPGQAPPIAAVRPAALAPAQMLSSIATLLHDTYLPLYMSDVLHMSNTKASRHPEAMGNLHGLLQLLSRASGVVSGRLADVLSPARHAAAAAAPLPQARRASQHSAMVILGVALTAVVCKPMFALCGSVYTVAGAAACVAWITYAKMFDRIVKGVREAPSKALVGELAAQSGDSAAAAFSVRQALSTLGMLLGSGAAALAFQLTGRSYEATFALSVIPALLGLALVASALSADAKAANAHPAAHSDAGGARLGLGKARAFLGALPRGYYQALFTMCILYLARFDVAFITVHAGSVMDKASLPMLTLFSMLPVVVLAAPLGMRAKGSVRSRNTVLVAGIAALIAGDLCFGFFPSVLGMVLGSTFVGLHMAATQGVLFGMLAAFIPSQAVPGLGRISGTVWSFTDLLLGVALAYSNSLAGRLCDVTAARGMGNTGCFFGGAVVSGAAILALLAFTVFGELGKEEQVAAAPKAA
ncbi:hypothetical protein CHLNCDRAFT_141928 [Chlorella variabilis]|uniref:Major facilitator superfamily (MFS) profile domain-containing protein n=1 Tax=Chlorella variabilis TaxID=554065 RepID=E1Z7C7_CHLVA|nr:hypothetical protein CHLNCDRAFT_141928 [Chlorella variabilis]EFN58148.1 hypothetical protein CHLNCDRAFT_141928 [Chlorella variabilis]|eukprot:XP_005850250.1 hypothetical protein CHLNCDRAFT_141928 [Chlorella variabilis]